MRVLVLSSTFPNASQPQRGVFVRERIRRLAKRCEVIVVAPVPWFPLNRWIRKDRAGVPFLERQGDLTVYHPRFFSLPRYGKFLDGVLCFLSLIPFVWRLRGRFRFEVIDAHFAFPDGLASVLLGRVFRCGVVVTLRGSIPRLAGYRLHRPQLRWTLTRAQRVVAVAHYLRRVAIGLGIAADHIRVIPNGVDLDTFVPNDRAQARRECGLPAEGPILLTVGALYGWKGQHMVVEALPMIRERHPRVLYVMVGGTRTDDRAYLPALRKRVSKLGLEAHVRFAGSQPHGQLGSWFNAADLSVLASRSEGCPNVVLESLACGVPVVATDVGGIPELIRDGRDGALVPYGDLRALADALLHVLSRQWDRAALVRRASEFDWNDAGEQALEELELALKDSR